MLKKIKYYKKYYKRWQEPINGGEEQVGREGNSRYCSQARANNRDEDENGDEDEDEDEDEDVPEPEPEPEPEQEPEQSWNSKEK